LTPDPAGGGGNLMRILSARDMQREERGFYEQETELIRCVCFGRARDELTIRDV
jgi:hypothetical protein